MPTYKASITYTVANLSFVNFTEKLKLATHAFNLLNRERQATITSNETKRTITFNYPVLNSDTEANVVNELHTRGRIIINQAGPQLGSVMVMSAMSIAANK